jgi:D-sedoheptulose 7-phosphate isomerase
MNNVDRFFVTDPAEFARRYFAYLSDVLRAIDVEEVAAFVRSLLDARARGAAIYFIGNGGSAATASHFANDLAIGTYATDPPFRAISLCDNLATITAIGNDFGYEQIFVRQLQAVAKPGDVLVAISASGNSPNLLRALEYAREHGIRTIALTAFDGGKMKPMADQGVHVPTELKEYGPAEDAHMALDHLLGAYLMRLVRAEC